MKAQIGWYLLKDACGYYESPVAHWTNMENVRCSFQLPPWILLAHEGYCSLLSYWQSVSPSLFFISMALLMSLWSGWDLTHQNEILADIVLLGVCPNSTRKGSARNFKRKTVFIRFPAFLTSQHVQRVQITFRWTLGGFTQIEIKQLSWSLHIQQWVQM